MIMEMRNYAVKPGTVKLCEDRFAEGISRSIRTQLSPMVAMWHTVVGPLNHLIHLWEYEGVAERERIREEAKKVKGWPPDIVEFIDFQETKILTPAPFTKSLTPQQLGGLYEIRTDTYGARSIPQVVKAWNTALGQGKKYPGFVGAYFADTGALNQWITIWAYKDAAERERVRNDEDNPGYGPDIMPTAMENILVAPAGCSLLR